MNNCMKVTIMGSSGVGKSCLLDRLVRNKYVENQPATIGAAFMTLRHEDYTINFWDTAGAEAYRSLAPLYIRGSGVVLVCSDEQHPHSFQPYIDSVRFVDENCLIVLVVTKNDSIDKLLPELSEFARQEKYALFYTSAKTGMGVDVLRRYIVDQYSALSQPKILPMIQPVKKKMCLLL